MSCTNINLPAHDADFCAPNINFGEIDKIYLGYDDQPLVDWSDLTEWNTRLDNTTLADLTKIRYLHVVGDKPAPEKNKIEISQSRHVYTEGKHTIEISVDETGAVNHALIQWLEANAGQTIRVWYQSGKYLHGGTAGVPANIRLDDIIPSSSDELNTFQGVIEWEGDTPDRITNPMA